MARYRKLKPQMKALLEDTGWQARLKELDGIPPRQALGPLFSFLLHGGELKWRSVTALGRVMDNLAAESMEEARIIMRRMIWNLCEESGNLGWGMPEAMGEIMAIHPGLASEYNRVLISYTKELGVDDTYIEHPPLRRAVYWGMGRLLEARPEYAGYALDSLTRGLEDREDAQIPGLAAWALGVLRHHAAIPLLEALVDRKDEVEMYRDRTLGHPTVGELVREALAAMAGAGETA